MTNNDLSVILWCTENNGDPEHCWWVNVPVLKPLSPGSNPNNWFKYVKIVCDEIQNHMAGLGVPIEKLIWSFGHRPSLPLNPKYFDKRKFN